MIFIYMYLCTYMYIYICMYVYIIAKVGHVDKTISNGLMTNTTLVSVGHDVHPTCTQCNLACDTPFHRCITCPMVEQEAKNSLGLQL